MIFEKIKVKKIIPDVCAVIPAAGCSKRMKMEYPKQYFLIERKTILEHTVSIILSHPRIEKVIIVIRFDDERFATLPLAKHPKITVINGGAKRVNSVLAGIQAAGNASWILVHDAVRPCLCKEDLIRLMKVSETSYIGGILATPVRDTIKRASHDKIISHTIKRMNLWHALTPQFFPRKILQNCLLRALNEGAVITDEASALEYCGLHPKLIIGRADNIKITYQEDLQFMKFYFSNKKKKEFL